ncbi:carboxypeptidase regulatory-like domain-containing protein, partial [Klebsiella pneumoniae]|nr:carboxypeptidase regulatory-like domain-containing protein [Klebsiella pneumoniae]
NGVDNSANNGSGSASRAPRHALVTGDLRDTGGENGGGLFVHGTVNDSAGTPVPGAVLTLTDANGRQVERTRTDSAGEFRLDVPHGGTYVLIASGGSRLQEGMCALRQLHEIARACLLARQERIPHIAVLRNPTTGGMWAVLAASADVVLALPGLLVLLVLAAADRHGPVPLVLAVAVLQVPPVVRLTRSAALEPACRTVVEAMLQQGEPWWRVHIVHTGRSVLGPVLVDAGHRLNVVLGLLASANFLGIGLAPDTSDWAVHIERNREALFLQPAAVLVPCALLASLCVG